LFAVPAEAAAAAIREREVALEAKAEPVYLPVYIDDKVLGRFHAIPGKYASTKIVANTLKGRVLELETDGETPWTRDPRSR
jgi:hypothetical protein